MKSAQFWVHANSHYVLLPCSGLNRFQIGQIPSICINTRLSGTLGSHVIFLISFFSLYFSINVGLSLTFCLQTLPRAFRHLLTYQLSHASCLKSWEQGETHGSAFFNGLAVCSLPPVGGVSMFVCFTRPLILFR